MYLKFKFNWPSYTLSGKVILPLKRKFLEVPVSSNWQLVCLCTILYYILCSLLEETLDTLQKFVSLTSNSTHNGYSGQV